METNRITSIVLMCLTLFSCHYYDNRLKIVNKTMFNISISTSNSLKDENIGHFAYYIGRTVQPYDSIFESKQGANGWPMFINSGSQKLLFIYIFNTDSLIRHQEKYLNMYELKLANDYYKLLAFTKKQLDSLNWSIEVR